MWIVAAVVWLFGFLVAFNVLADEGRGDFATVIFAAAWPLTFVLALVLMLCDAGFSVVAWATLTALEKIGVRKVTYAKVYHMNGKRDD